MSTVEWSQGYQFISAYAHEPLIVDLFSSLITTVDRSESSPYPCRILWQMNKTKPKHFTAKSFPVYQHVSQSLFPNLIIVNLVSNFGGCNATMYCHPPKLQYLLICNHGVGNCKPAMSYYCGPSFMLSFAGLKQWG